MTTFAQIALDPVVVTPGGEATTTLTVRNDSDIVEAYELEVVGDTAAWSTITPARVSLYPGTAETVTVRLTPPRSPAVRAGEIPLGVRVLPVERPDSVVVPETTVLVEPFGQLAAQLAPRRRRGWLGARYRVTVYNQGNAPADVLLTAAQAGDDLKFAIAPDELPLEPGTDQDARLRVRVAKRIWFGKPVTWPFTVLATPRDADTDGVAERAQEIPGELVQLPILPRWLLALLAALLALLVAWFALVGPAVRSSATQAANQAVAAQAAAATSSVRAASGSGASGGGASGGAVGAGGGGTASGAGQQSSATIQVQTGGGTRKVGTYTVPAGKTFEITDIVLANFQGDQGLLTISFGSRIITTIALETFRNQDYHWVTPIGVPAGGTVSADVTCSVPGTPASGQQAAGCAELLNVSGTLQNTQH
ncbi:MAG TPA: hydrolytic protein [Pseudonocardiaceae bacterium]